MCEGKVIPGYQLRLSVLLQFKPVKNGAFRSVPVSLGYRALGVPVDPRYAVVLDWQSMQGTINYSFNLTFYDAGTLAKNEPY